MKYFIFLLSLIFFSGSIESYDLSTWKAWQPALNKYLGRKYVNFYRLGGSFPGPEELQQMIKADVEKLSRSNPKKALEFYKVADQISKKSPMPLFDAKAIKQDIARKMKTSMIDAMDGVPTLANKRANKMLSNFSAYPEARNEVNALVEKEVAKVRDRLINDFENIDDLDPKALQKKINEMCALSKKFPSENEFTEICEKVSEMGRSQSSSDKASPLLHSSYNRVVEQGTNGKLYGGMENQKRVDRKSWLKAVSSEAQVKSFSTGNPSKLEAKLVDQSQVDLEKISSIKLLYLNKDACNLMEIRPADQLSMNLCINSNREISSRKRKDLRGWTKVVQEFSKQRELEFRKRLNSINSTY